MESRLIGKIVSRRFRVEEIIGRGGMAIVYRAYDLKTKQTVAFKVLREEYEEDPEYRERFNREAEVCKRLNHPNIVNMIDSGSVGGVHYIALEYVDGKTLKDIIKEEGKLPQEEAAHYALQILAALGHAHARRIIHRDVKPQNLLVTRSGQLKVGDFGIAGMADTKTLTSDGSVIGSVHYFSPEQAKGMKATEASDLYSVGVILYEMLTGRVPFDGETAVSVAMMHLMKEPKPVETEAEVSPALARIVAKALRKQPHERYQSADAMTKDLRRGLRHPDGRFMENEHLHRTMQHSVIRKPNRVLQNILRAAAALLICVTAASAWYLYRYVFVLSTVPDVMGVDRTNAERLLSSAGLASEVAMEYSDQAEGTILGTVPEAGEALERGKTVVIRISQGTGLVIVPSITGITADEARTRLATEGLAAGEVTETVSEVMKGLVVSQTPEAGSRIAAGEQVAFTVSVGRVIVPELVNQREEEAMQRIEQVGLSVGQITAKEVRSPSQDGYVLEQSLPQFMEAEPGEVISLVVGRYSGLSKTMTVEIPLEVPDGGCTVRVTLVDGNAENEMYAATHETPGETTVSVQLRSDTSGTKKYRIYVDGNLREEREVTFL